MTFYQTCCEMCSRTTLLILNSILVLFSVLLLSGESYALSQLPFSALEGNKENISLIILLGLTILIIIIGGLGMLSASMSYRPQMLKIYIIILIVLLLTTFAIGIFLLVQGGKTEADGEFGREYFQSAIENYDTNEYKKKFVDVFQENFDCCGSNSSDEWGDKVPKSCCKGDQDQCNVTDKDDLFSDGCDEKYQSFLTYTYQTLGWCGLGIMVAESLCFVCAISVVIRGERNVKSDKVRKVNKKDKVLQGNYCSPEKIEPTDYEVQNPEP